MQATSEIEEGRWTHWGILVELNRPWVGVYFLLKLLEWSTDEPVALLLCIVCGFADGIVRLDELTVLYL